MIKRVKRNKYLMGTACCLMLLLSFVFPIHAQLSSTALDDFGQPLINPYILNPAASDSSYKWNLRANNLNELGFIKNVRRYYADVDFRLNATGHKTFHFVGLLANNSTQGEFISKSSMQLRYSYYGRLSSEAALSSGLSVGFINYAFLTSQGGAGGTDYAPELCAGIHIITKKSLIGFSIQHLFPAVLTPIQQSFQLNRIYTFDISEKIVVSPQLNLSAYSIIQYTSDRPLLYLLGLITDFSNGVMIGVNNYSLKRTTASFGLRRIRIAGIHLMLAMHYSIYHSDLPASDNSFEQYVGIQK